MSLADLPKVRDDLPYSIANSRRSGPWQKGQSGNPAGRPKATRERLGTRFVDALSEVFEKKGKRAIDYLADNDPATFVRVCASLMPKELLVSSGPLADLSQEEIAALAYAAKQAVALADKAKSELPKQLEHEPTKSDQSA